MLFIISGASESAKCGFGKSSRHLRDVCVECGVEAYGGETGKLGWDEITEGLHCSVFMCGQL